MNDLINEMPRSVSWCDGTLHLLDQRLLPHEEKVVVCEDIEQVFNAIQTLTVRGAPAIGIAAAYGLTLGLEKVSPASFIEVLDERCEYLISARPTAVNLEWAINRMRKVVDDTQFDSAWCERLLDEARAIHEEDAIACRGIAEAGLALVRQHPRLLTHCNAGSLAVSELGTALAPIYRAHEEGVEVHVFVDETRPLLQGARLTAYELSRNGVDCTLISDNMAAHIMSEGLVDMVIVGADRIAANGDAANKIGTLGVAILCQYFSIPFYVAVPRSTIDTNTSSGAEILIEERSPDEVTRLGDQQIAPAGVVARSPAFDVTPAALITGIITDKGILNPPFDVAIVNLMESR